ncbi:FMN-binding negative transcriptional regulator [Polyangium sorediatum]|uniref:FMN-binding negative transcriptional regulator n=1 Tax=Polyangium sorediatum TaxID=889274 RepID=A0ABT6PA39_9BACT|nr:FMN-binding negative transcriptional regulator [Polyangium sorediatum]MDI1437496.1 FMN-binding negative transcriptional regulator [Polyangium sorediatum]
MYLPRAFQESDPAEIHDFIEAHSFGALLVAKADGALEIAHLPFLLDRRAGPHGTLRAHVARPNPIWKLAAAGHPATVVFSGPHGYVSARWYEHPREQVPTWNYMVVHAHGRLEAPMDRAGLSALLDDLSSFHERGAPEPWRMDQLEDAFREELLDAIVGLSLPIDRLEAKFKLSQNRSPEDRARVIRALRERGGPDDLAMAKRIRE